MTQIAVGQSPRTNVGRVATGILLLALGVGGGIGIGQVTLQAKATTQAATGSVEAIAANHAWLEYRADERQGAAGLGGDAGYQAQRAGERAGLPSLSGNAGYQEFRSGERNP